jgi:hyperosmotically inducible protein
MNMRNLCGLSLCLSLALILGSVVPAAADTPANTPANNSDAVLTQELQKEFSDHLEFRNVAASVDDRIATLQGSVENYRDKLEAEKLARKHRKIEGIRDYITVVPIVNVPDSELQSKLADRLRYDRIGYGIQFNNLEPAVKDGVVTVRGEVRTYPDKASALAIVEDTPGVRDIRDEIQVLPLSTFDDDLRIQAAKAIYGDPELRKYALDPQAPIRIIVEDGHLKLYGVVDSDMDKHVAELRASGVRGVFSVENKLIVNGQREQKLADSVKPETASKPEGTSLK